MCGGEGRGGGKGGRIERGSGGMGRRKCGCMVEGMCVGGGRREM